MKGRKQGMRVQLQFEREGPGWICGGERLNRAYRGGDVDSPQLQAPPYSTEQPEGRYRSHTVGVVSEAVTSIPAFFLEVEGGLRTGWIVWVR